MKFDITQLIVTFPVANLFAMLEKEATSIAAYDSTGYLVFSENGDDDRPYVIVTDWLPERSTLHYSKFDRYDPKTLMYEDESGFDGLRYPIIAAPFQEQVIDWLIKNYNLHIHCMYDNETCLWHGSIRTHEKVYKSFIDEPSFIHESKYSLINVMLEYILREIISGGAKTVVGVS